MSCCAPQDMAVADKERFAAEMAKERHRRTAAVSEEHKASGVIYCWIQLIACPDHETVHQDARYQIPLW